MLVQYSILSNPDFAPEYGLAPVLIRNIYSSSQRINCVNTSLAAGFSVFANDPKKTSMRDLISSGITSFNFKSLPP